MVNPRTVQRTINWLLLLAWAGICVFLTVLGVLLFASGNWGPGIVFVAMTAYVIWRGLGVIRRARSRAQGQVT